MKLSCLTVVVVFKLHREKIRSQFFFEKMYNDDVNKVLFNFFKATYFGLYFQSDFTRTTKATYNLTITQLHLIFDMGFRLATRCVMCTII